MGVFLAGPRQIPQALCRDVAPSEWRILRRRFASRPPNPDLRESRYAEVEKPRVSFVTLANLGDAAAVSLDRQRPVQTLANARVP